MFGEKLKAIADKLVDIYKRGYGEGYAANGGTAGLSYALSEDETYYICDGIGTASETDIVIASYRDGKPVNEIASDAFSGNKSITSVFIPDCVTSIKRNAFYGCSAMTSLRIGIGVVEIGQSAFDGCASLTSVTIPDSVTNLSWYAFRNCTSLKDATILCKSDIGWDAFYNCTSLENVKIGDNVTGIGGSAFANCTSLKSITIPDRVYEIEENAFENCSAMTSLRLGKVEYIKQGAFNNCTGLEEIYYNSSSLTIINSANKIFANAGRKRSGIKITIGAGVKSIPNCLFCPDVSNYDLHPYINSIEFEEGCQCTSIGDYAFFRLAIKNINIPATVRSIGSNAFYNCQLLASIAIPDSVTEIGTYAFYNCREVNTLEIGAGVKTIGNYAFKGLVNLRELYFNAANMDDLTSNIKIFEDCGNAYHNNGIKVVIGAKVTKIPAYLLYINSNYKPNVASIEFEENSVCTSIGDYAFGCAPMTSLIVPDSVTSIGTYAFVSCSSLENVKVGNGVVSIGSNAFKNCKALKRVYISDIGHWCGITFADAYANPLSYGYNLYLNDELVYSLVIPEGVTSIGSYAFYHCLSIVSVTIPDTVTKIGTDVFTNCAKIAEIVNKSTLASPFTPSIEEHLGETKVNNVDGYLFYTYMGTNYLVGYVGNDEELILPEDYNGESYTINASAFIHDRFTSVIIGNGVEEILYGAFKYCINLVSAEFTGSSPSLYSHIFAYCYSLTNVKLPDDIPLINTSTFYYCTSLTSITLPDSVTEIKNNAFYYCTSLTSITIPNGVTKIGMAAFSTSGLTSVIIPDSVTLVDREAFVYCFDLAKVLIGSGVSKVLNTAFNGCNNLYNIYCKFADGAVISAPWGAVNATITYNATLNDYNSEV